MGLWLLQLDWTNLRYLNLLLYVWVTTVLVCFLHGVRATDSGLLQGCWMLRLCATTVSSNCSAVAGIVLCRHVEIKSHQT